MTVVRLFGFSLNHFGNVQNFNLSKSCPHVSCGHVWKGWKCLRGYFTREKWKRKMSQWSDLFLKEKVLENPPHPPTVWWVYVELRWWSKFLVSSSSVLLCYQLLYGTLGWQMVFDLQTRLGKTLTVLWISDKYVLFQKKNKKNKKNIWFQYLISTFLIKF